MLRTILISFAGLSFIGFAAVSVAWWRNERRNRREFLDALSYNARQRLGRSARTAREAENAAKIDQRMAEIEAVLLAK